MSVPPSKGGSGKDPAHWSKYYDMTKERAPRQTLLRALETYRAAGHAPGDAIDLGAGAGPDALELLRREWRVLAIDSSAEGLELLAERAAAAKLPGRLRCRQATMDEGRLPPADLVNASFCLFLLPRPVLELTFSRIAASLRRGGRFAGHLLGPKDSWCGEESVTCVEKEDLARLLAPLEIEELREEIDEGKTPRGETKQWHIFHIVAKVPD